MNTFAIVLGHISLCLILYDRTSQVALMVKNLPAKAGGARHTGLISGSRRSPGGGNGTPLQYSCLENPIDKGAWQATVHGVVKSCTRLSNWACRHVLIHLSTTSISWASLPLDVSCLPAWGIGELGPHFSWFLYKHHQKTEVGKSSGYAGSETIQSLPLHSISQRKP